MRPSGSCEAERSTPIHVYRWNRIEDHGGRHEATCEVAFVWWREDGPLHETKADGHDVVLLEAVGVR